MTSQKPSGNRKPAIQIEAEELIAAFNTDRRRRSKIPYNKDVLFNILSILARKEDLETMNDPDSYGYLHTRKAFTEYQNELAKIKKVIDNGNQVTEVILLVSQGKQIRLRSKLLFHSLFSELPENNAKRSRGGRPDDVIIEHCIDHIRALQMAKVPVTFLAQLFEKTPNALKQALCRAGTKPH